MKIRYVGGISAVYVPSIGQVVGRGETVDVDPLAAGRGPGPDDLGYGLLAQSDIWEIVAEREVSK